MPLLPDKTNDFLTFCETHAEVWKNNAASIGLTPVQAEAFKTATAATRADFTAKVDADNAKKAATLTSQKSVRDLRQDAADLVRFIRAFAAANADPDGVYARAQIPAPAAPGPTPPPGTPFEFRVELLQGGAIVLRWKCNNPEGTSGTIYEVRRKPATPANATWAFVGATGVKSFADETVPAAAAALGGVVYQVTAVRSTTRGLPAEFNVAFGVAPGGGLTIASVTEMPVKLAA